MGGRPRSRLPAHALLRATPPKGGDAEPRGYRGRRSATLAGPPATDMGRRWRPGVRWDPRRVAMPFAYKLAYRDRKSTRLNSSHGYTSYAAFCLKKKPNMKI